MAYIRTIKQSFFTSEDIVALSPLARLLYIALWIEADREGRLVWKLKTIKLRYFPADACDIQEMANELIQLGLVLLYEVDGCTYGDLPTFTKHQAINNRERASTLPPRVPDANATRTAHVSDAAFTPLQGKEGKGKSNARQVTREEPDEYFDAFWDAYPKKVAKQDAMQAWKKLAPSAETIAALMKGLEQAKISPSWKQDGGQYIPYPATWLNSRRWEDEMPAAKSVADMPDYAKGAV